MQQRHLKQRLLQKSHSFVLFNSDEFSELIKKGASKLPDRHIHHFKNVFRRKEAWHALIGDGAGRCVNATIQENQISAEAEIQPITAKPLNVILVQAILKPKAMALVLQKCAELGVAEIVLLKSERVQGFMENKDRIDAILENACMQSVNFFKPLISSLDTVQSIATLSAEKYVGSLSAEQKLFDIKFTSNTQKLAYINGPEGGFSENEIAALSAVATPVLLSENVLRAETAAIIATGFLTSL